MVKEKLGNLYDIGSSKRVFQSEWREKGVPFYRAREIARLSEDGYVDNELFIDEDLYEEYIERYGKPQPGDVMVTGVGTLGVCYVVKPDDKFYFKDGNILWFKQKAPNRILPEYLVKAFDSKEVKDFISKNSSGTTVGTFTIQTANKMEISLPPLNQQKEIIERISKLEGIIKQRQLEIEKLDELVKARFIELFGDLKTNTKNWTIVSFNDCAVIDTNMIHDFDGYEGYPHIGIDSIEKDTGRLVGYRTIEEDGVISGKYLFSPRHIIYSKIRPNLNKVALPDFDGLCSADAYPILVKEDVCTREFFGYTLRSSYFLEYILAFSNRTNLPKVNKNQVEGFNLPLPEIGVQRQFTEFVKQVDKSKVAVQKALDEAQLLFDSLMHKYFG